MARPASALALAVALGCAHATNSETLDPALAGENPEAIENFRAGEDALAADNWVEAQKRFDAVRAKYPYSALAPLAELKLADTHFARERFAEAADAYRSFVKLHPNHPRVDSAAFRAALSAHREMPSDFILFPPAVEKEQVHARAALRELEDFIAAYPRSEKNDEAQRLREEVRRRLAEHEMYVARFYKKREKLRAVALRLETLLNRYPGVALEPEAMLELGRTYVLLDEVDKAREILRKLVAKHPLSPQRAVAEDVLRQVG